MNMSRLTLSVVVAAALCLSGASCSKIIYAPQYQTGSVTHVVVCTLKDRGNYEAAKQRIHAACLELRSLPDIWDIEVGPALPSSSPGAVNDFDLAVVITFRSAAALQTYLTHPTHQRIVKDVLEPLTDMSKTRTFDFTNQEYQ